MICRRCDSCFLHLVNVVLWCAFAVKAQSLDVPFLAGRVNDVASMLPAKTIDALEALLKAHEDSTSNQVVVLTIPSLRGEPLEEYSIKVVDTWKLGQKDKDNGVLLLIVRDDRKVRIEVGNGLEGDLPDITCGQIIRNEIVSRFRNSDYEGGIRAGVSAILGAILLAIYLVGFPLIKLWFAKTKKGQTLVKKWSVGASTGGTNLRSGRASRSRRESSGSSGWSFGGGSSGGFSGGGGSFSGGGASGSW